MNIRATFFSCVSICIATLFALTSAGAQGITDTVGERAESRGGEGEAHLVLTYKCSAQNRAAFRAFMETKGVEQFEAWKKKGVMKTYLILFSTFYNEQLNDMWIILDFDRFADIGNWYEVEKTYVGGLSKEGLVLTSPKTNVYTDLAWQGGKSNADLAKSVFMIIPYKTLVPIPQYDDFVDKYVIPQVKGWVKSGLMPSYRIHVNQNPTKAPWDSLLVFEYDGLKGIALRDTLKNDVRRQIKDDPGYKKYSPIKTTIRTEDEPTTFVAILPKK